MFLSGGEKNSNQHPKTKNIQQILIFFMFFKFMLLKFSAYLSHKYYRAFSFVRFAVCCRKLLLFSSHRKQKHKSEVEKNIRPDTSEAYVTTKKKREKLLMKIWKFNSSGFYPFANCFCTFSFSPSFISLFLHHTNNE